MPISGYYKNKDDNSHKWRSSKIMDGYPEKMNYKVVSLKTVKLNLENLGIDLAPQQIRKF